MLFGRVIDLVPKFTFLHQLSSFLLPPFSLDDADILGGLKKGNEEFLAKHSGRLREWNPTPTRMGGDREIPLPRVHGFKRFTRWLRLSMFGL